jgi:hypothetical protein
MHSYRTLLTWFVIAGVGVGCGDDDGGGADGGGDGGDAGEGCISAMVLADGSGTSAEPDGIGGDGDLALDNGVIRAVFAAVDRPSGIAASGGTLIDLHFIGQGDHLNEFSQLAGPDQALQVRYSEMAIAQMESNRAVIEVSGHVQPQPPDEGEEAAVTPDPGTDLAVTTRYEMRCGEARVHVQTTIENTGDTTYETGLGFGVMDVVYWGGRALAPFCPSVGAGDRCPDFDIDNPLPGLVESQWVGSVGSLVGQPGTFAFYPEDPNVTTFLGVHSDQVSSFGFFRAGDSSMPAGAIHSLGRVIVVGEGADAASGIDGALDGLAEAGVVEIGTVSGTVSLPGGEALSTEPYGRPLVLLATPGSGSPTDPDRWTPVTMVRVGADGSFSARVPAGDIAWELRASGRAPSRGEGGTVESGMTLDLGVLEAAAAPALTVHVRGPADAALPARVIVRGADGTDDPGFGSGAGGSPAGFIALTDGEGDVTLRLAAGAYDVYATHGMGYTLARERVDVADADAEITLELEPAGVFPDGFLTADFHVHSAASMDSSLPIDDRVRSFLNAGVDAIVSTEHDVIFDYGPALATVEETLPPSWRGNLRTFVGIESTATVPQPDFVHTTGHHNAFPLTPQLGLHRSGAPEDEYLDLGTLYETLRGLPSPGASTIVQLNHARASRSGSIWLGYFDACGFVPTAAFDESSTCFNAVGPMGTRPWDFDAFEIINGKDARDFVNMSRDWFALLLNAPGGRLPVGTANSDSHRLFLEEAGFPVTVLSTELALSELTDDALVDLVNGGAVAGSLGVFVWATVSESGGDGTEAGPGRAPLSASSGQLVVHARVAAPPWVPVEELRVRVNGEVVARLGSGDLTEPVDPFGTEGAVRFEGDVDLSGTVLDADAFVTLEAGFALPAVADLDGDGLVDDLVLPDPPEFLDVVAVGARAMGFTNPVFVDVDGNGSYDAPGTPLSE